MRLHPTVEAFWYPIAYAIPGGLFGVAVGWILAGLDKPYGFQSGLMLGALTAWGTWIIMAFFWLAVLWRSMAQPRAVEPVQHITDAEVAEAEFDPAWIEIHCTLSNDIHILRHLPVDYETLQRYAVGIRQDGKKTVYNDWKSDIVLKDQEAYRILIQWLVDNHFGYLDYRNTLVISERGKDLFADILQPQFEVPSPLDVGNQRNIRIYSDMNKKG